MIKTISMSELHEKQENLAKNPSNDEMILDVRTPDEYRAGHVPGSRNISHEMVGGHAAELSKFKTVYLYCRSGGRVQFACHELSQMGLTNLVAVVSGGMPDWIAAGFPVEK